MGSVTAILSIVLLGVLPTAFGDSDHFLNLAAPSSVFFADQSSHGGQSGRKDDKGKDDRGRNDRDKDDRDKDDRGRNDRDKDDRGRNDRDKDKDHKGKGNHHDDDDDDGGSLPARGTVSVVLVDGTASETGTDTGVFRLVRTASQAAPMTSPLVVTFSLTGTAENGIDYQLIQETVTFLPGQSTVDVVVRPIADPLVEDPETVILMLTYGLTYDLTDEWTATVTISD